MAIKAVIIGNQHRKKMDPVKKKSPITAALLSGLAFPGLGYLYLRQFRIRIPVVLATVTIIGVLINHGLKIANIILVELQGDPSIPDYNALFELVHQTLEQNNSVIYDIISYTLPILWIGSTIHCYVIGKRLRQVNSEQNELG